MLRNKKQKQTKKIPRQAGLWDFERRVVVPKNISQEPGVTIHMEAVYLEAIRLLSLYSFIYGYNYIITLKIKHFFS